MTDEQFLEIKNTMKTEWKQLIYNGEYQNYDVSNTGRIRYHNNGKELKLSKTRGMKNCYEFITITLNDGTTRNVGIHRLVAIMFIKVPSNYIKKGKYIDSLVVDHKDDVKYHNIVQNLQWLTPKENIKKFYKSISSKNDLLVDDKTVKKICKDLMKETTIYEISQKYNVSELLVYDIRYRKRYKEISEKYAFHSYQLSEEDVVKICEDLHAGLSAKAVSDKYNYPIGAVVHILCRDSWTQISSKYTFPNSRVKDDVIHGICKMLEDGKSVKEISEYYNVGKRLVEHIKLGDTHTDISKNYNIIVQKFKLSDETIHNICKDLASKEYTNKEVSERNNVSLSFVKDIKYRRSRTDISENYEW